MSPAIERVGLKPKEVRVTQLVADGLTNSEIGKAIGTTQNVIRNYLQIVFDKTGMNSRLELALWYVSNEQAP